MVKCSGTVIGGKHAGEFHSVDSPILNLAVPMEISLTRGPYDFKLEDMLPVASYESYKHVSMYWRNDKTGEEWKYGFWVPTDTQTPQPYILETLLNDYRKN